MISSSNTSCRSLRSTQMENGRFPSSGSSVMAPNVNIQLPFRPSRIPEVVRQNGRLTSVTRRNNDSDVALIVLTPLDASWIGPPNGRYVAVRSMTATSAPALRRQIAANSPPSPPPATSTRKGASLDTASPGKSADEPLSVSHPGVAAPRGTTRDCKGRATRLDVTRWRDRVECVGRANDPTVGARAAMLARSTVRIGRPVGARSWL